MGAFARKQSGIDNISTIKSHQSIKNVDCGLFQYIPDRREIKINGRYNKLSPTPAAILNHLILNQGRAVLRQELMTVAWAEGKKVNEANFYQMIRRLREALDDTTEPRKIIINPLKNVYALKPQAIIRYQQTKQEKQKILWRLMALVVLTIASVFIYLKWPHPEEIASYKATAYNPITTLNGQIESAVVSPDNTIVVFSHKAPHSSGLNLMAKRMGTEEYATLVPFSDLMQNNEPAFSPSGKQLAWVANDFKEIARCHIMIADFNPKTMSLDNERVAMDCSVPNYGRTPQWKTENTLLISLPPSATKPNRIMEFNLTTKEQFLITSPNSIGYGDYGLFYSRSANKMAYVRQSTSTGTGTDLRMYDFATKTDSHIKSYPHALYTVAWADDQHLLTNGRDGFEIITLDGQALPILSDSIDAQNFPFSMGENQVGFVRGNIDAKDISIVDLVDKTKDVRLSSNSHDYRVVLAKNTNDIAFVSNRTGKFQVIFTHNKIPKQITQFKDQIFIFDIAISPNGNSIAFVGNNQLTVLNRYGKLLYQKAVSVKGLSFSADGTRLLFGVNLGDLQLIKRVSLKDYSESTVTDGFMPKADEEGNIFFFRNLKHSKKPVLHKMTPRGGVIELFSIPFKLVNSNSFDVMNNQLFYVRNEDKKLMLVSQDLVTGKIASISPVTDSKFSLNKSLTKLVTTQRGRVQNNLVSFKLVREKPAASHTK